VTDPVAAVHPEHPGPPSSWRIDTRPLRQSRDFRLIWASGLVTYLGSITTYVALPFQVKELTGSLALAGLLGVAELVPMIVFGLWGGALADARDRKKMVVWSEVGMLVLAGVLLANALLAEPQVEVLFAVAGLFAIADALQRPSLDAMIPNVVAHDQLTAASALGSVRFEVGSIGGPALAGALLTVGDTWMAYAFDLVTYAVSLLLLVRIAHVTTPAADAVAGLRAISEGLAYAWRRKDLLGTYTVDVMAMVFGMSTAIFPFVAVTLDAPWAVGLLFAAPAVGSLLVSLTSGWTSRVHRHGLAIAAAAATYGLMMAVVGLAPSIWVALAALAAAGGADMVSGIFRDAVWNGSIPDELRGRLAGVELLSYSTGPILGNARAGLVASVVGVRASIVSGGLLAVAATLAATAAMRDFRRYDNRTNPHAVARRAARADQ
jgi:MFS family permease